VAVPLLITAEDGIGSFRSIASDSMATMVVNWEYRREVWLNPHIGIRGSVRLGGTLTESEAPRFTHGSIRSEIFSLELNGILFVRSYRMGKDQCLCCVQSDRCIAMALSPAVLAPALTAAPSMTSRPRLSKTDARVFTPTPTLPSPQYPPTSAQVTMSGRLSQ
jgi:hypothetical protein